jgi:NDP-sugar pyrophosphorylase family protein
MTEFRPKVVVLCGGIGTRLKPLTDTIPKALVPIHGRPVIEYLLDHAIKEGFKNYILCIGHKGGMIRDHFAAHPLPGVNLEFSDAGENSSMLQRLVTARTTVSNRLMVCYGDTISDIRFNDLISFHSKSNAMATIATVAIRNPFGLVKFQADGQASSFEEKPVLNYYVGLSVIEAAALDHYATKDLVCRPDGAGLIDFFHRIMEDGRLFVFQHEGLQITFNTDTERKLAEDQLIRFYTQNEP